MRTTIRLPDDLYRRVRVVAATDGETVTSFIEEALRAALARHDQAPSSAAYRVKPFQGNRLQPGVDLDDNAALLDLMDADARP
jgi:plasmid stability protein